MIAIDHEQSAPRGAPKLSKQYTLESAYKATLEEPNISGPTAPEDTAEPCESQTLTMLVQKIAGKTEATPETTPELR